MKPDMPSEMGYWLNVNSGMSDHINLWWVLVLMSPPSTGGISDSGRQCIRRMYGHDHRMFIMVQQPQMSEAPVCMWTYVCQCCMYYTLCSFALLHQLELPLITFISTPLEWIGPYSPIVRFNNNYHTIKSISFFSYIPGYFSQLIWYVYLVIYLSLSEVNTPHTIHMIHIDLWGRGKSDRKVFTSHKLLTTAQRLEILRTIWFHIIKKYTLHSFQVLYPW